MASGWLDRFVRAPRQEHEDNAYSASANQGNVSAADEGLLAALVQAREALATSRENEDRLRLLVDQARDYLTDARHRIQTAEARAESLQAQLDRLRESDQRASTGFVTMDGYEADLKKLRALLEGAVTGPTGHGYKASEAG